MNKIYDEVIEFLFSRIKEFLSKEIGVIVLQDLNDSKSKTEIKLTYTDEIMEYIKVIEQLKLLQQEKDDKPKKFIEVDFESEIYKKTGKVLGEYGFIAGRETPKPFGSLGMTAAANIPGFRVWKKVVGDTKQGYMERDFKSEGIAKNLENIINFLNE